MRPFPTALGLTFGLGLVFATPALLAQDTPQTPKAEGPAAKDPAAEDGASPDLELYRQGTLRYHRGDHAAAIERFTELLEKHPQSPRAAEVRFWRASALEESGRRQEALEAYRVLRKLAPKSGWSKDAARRIERLARTASPGRVECQVQLAKGKPFTAQLHELNSEGVLLSGGEFKTPTRVPFKRLVKLEVAGGAKRMLVLSNGDRVSGRFMAVDPEGILVEARGIKDPIRVPLTRLRELRVPGRAGVAWVGTQNEFAFSSSKPAHMGAMAFALGDEDEAEVERETTVNPDGSRTTTTVDGAGRKTVTTVTRDGKGRRVLIKRGEGDEGATIELKLDGGVVGEALLGDLAGELPGELGEQLGDLDLDLDLEIDDSELRELDEALRELPKELRERIHRSLRGRHKGAKQRQRQRQRRVWVERGRGGEERVIILDGDEGRRAGSKRAKRIQKKVVIVGGDDEEDVIVLEGKGGEGRPGRRVEKRIVIVEGDEDEGPHRRKRVRVFGREGREAGPGDRAEKHVMIFEGDEDEDEVDVDVFVTPDGKKVIRKRIRKGSPKGTFTLRGGSHDHGDEEDVDVFVTPDGKKVVRKRIRKAGSAFAKRSNDFTFGPGMPGADFTKGGGNVYGWVQGGPARQTKDRVFLRNGDALSGKIRSLDGEGLRLDTDYGSVTIRRDQIRQVTFATPKKPFLGVSMKATARGVEVTHVHDDSAAAVAGLKTGDVIVQVGQKRSQDAAPITVEALGEAINKRRVGEVIHFWVRRGEELKLMEARLAERPHQVSTRALHLVEGGKALATKEKAHLELAKLKALGARERAHAEKLRARGELERAHEHLQRAQGELKRAGKIERKRATKLVPSKPTGKPRLGVALAEKDGAVTVSQVMKGSLAARLGLQAGDRIVKFQGKAIKSIGDVAAGMKGLEAGAEASLEISRTKGNQVQVLQLRFTFK